MLSIAKLRVGQEAYQLSGVAQSLDDYYTGDGEAAGVWMGNGAERLGLGGEVAADDLRAILAGIAPGTGGLSPNNDTIKPHPRRVPGFDLCFKLPKSLSVLYAVSDDPRVQGAIIEAGEAALRSTLGWLEREAFRVRRGSGDERRMADLARRDPDAASNARVRVLPATGMAAAAFGHRTSRAGDPLLHWHVLVPNLVEGPDGRWSAFVHPELFRNARAAGEVFQAAVRVETTTRLGIAWRPGRHVPEVAGVPQRICDQFSRRSKEIEAWLEATGIPDDAAGRQAAVLATRRGKQELEGRRFDLEWKAEALAAGWGPDAAESLLASLTPAAEPPIDTRWRLPSSQDDQRRATLGDQLVDQEVWIAQLVDQHLTTGDAVFTRPQVVQAVAAQLGAGASVSTVDRITDRVLASDYVIPVHDAENPDSHVWTSRRQAAMERRLLSLAQRSLNGRSPVPVDVLDAVLESRPTLGHDQVSAVRTLALGRDGVSVLIGPAGTGKTYTLDVVRETFQGAGYTVIGAAPSARAALALASGARMPSRTLHRLLGDWNAGNDQPSHRTLLVVDEAAMAGTRELEPTLRAVISAGGRVLLAGDHRQLPAVAAGGAFAALAGGDMTVATLSVNRRQVEPWEQDALGHLRDGHVPAAVHAYREHGRVVAAAGRTDMVKEAVDRWFMAREDGSQPVLLAGTNAVVDALNAAVRQELVDRSLLPTATALISGGRAFAVGERVVIRRNSYRERTVGGGSTAIVNGEVGTVVDGNANGLLVRSDLDQRVVVIDADYIAQGKLDYAYALTTARAQGGTWDLAIGVGLDGLYREAGYTQLSRGTQSNWLILTEPEIEQIDHELARHGSALPLPSEVPENVDEELRHRLDRSRAKFLALARDPHADHVASLAGTVTLPELEARARHCRHVETEATRLAGADPRKWVTEVARAQHTAEHLGVGVRVKAHDRHNIGTIVSFDDESATATVWFRAADGKEAERELSWTEIEVLDDTAVRRDLPPAAQAGLETLVGPLKNQIEQWHAHLAANGVSSLDADHHERAAALQIERTARQLSYARPAWLHTLIGPRPEYASPASVWDEAVQEIAAYRLRHFVPEHAAGIGLRPTVSSHAVQEWDRASRQIASSRIWLDSYAVRPVIPIARSRSRDELVYRRVQLDAILATAPDDQRKLIARLTSDLPIPPVELAAMLDEALGAQGARRHWILEHWPHVVEHHEVTRALSPQAPEADVGQLLDAIAVREEGLLRQAVLAGEPWLSTTVAHLVNDATMLTDDAIESLHAVADYRQRWNISHKDPLGVSASSSEHAAEREALVARLARDASELSLTLDVPDVPERSISLDEPAHEGLGL